MRDYTYHLATMAERRALGVEWQICPQCGKKEYKPYVDAAGQPLAMEVGKCDRINNCQYHKAPGQWFKEHPEVKVEAQKYKAPARQIETIYMPVEFVKRKSGQWERNPLLRYLLSLPLSNVQMERLQLALLAYGVGTSKDGQTIWWQIDGQMRVRSGKLMAYLENGHRDKAHPPKWIHSLMRDRWPADRYEYAGCLFGEHLVKTLPEADICLVESEKSAVICSAFWPMDERLFLATGGLSALNEQKIAPLVRAKRKIIAMPDHDGYERWKVKAKELGAEIKVDPTVEKWWDPEKDSETADVADILLRLAMENPSPNEIPEREILKAMRKQHPNFDEACRTIGLELTNPEQTIKF